MKLPIRSLLCLLLAGTASGMRIHVDDDAEGLGDGSSWADAYVDLQDALAGASAGDQIWVAGGSYRPTSGSNRSTAFEIPDGVELYGGFAGDELLLAQRDWQANHSVLSGDIGVSDDDSDNSYTIVRLSGVGARTLLDGFVLHGGRDGPALSVLGGSPEFRRLVVVGNEGHNYGGGAYLVGGATPTFREVEFRYNRSRYRGGGVASEGGSVPRFFDALFEFNSSDSVGGALAGEGEFFGVRFCNNSSFDGGGAVNGGGVFVDVLFESNSTFSGAGGAVSGYGSFENVVFQENVSVGSGGSGAGLRVWRGSTLTNVLFRGNVSSRSGGGMWDQRGGSSLRNVVFANNRASWGGGYFVGPAMATPPEETEASSALLQVSFVGNVAEGLGASLANRLAELSVTNCVLWSGGMSASDHVNQQSGRTIFSHSLVEGCGGSGAGWLNDLGTDAGGNLDVDPRWDEEFRLRRFSPAINAGDSAALPPDLEHDYDGRPRMFGEAVDLGAFEWQGVDGEEALSWGQLRLIYRPE